MHKGFSRSTVLLAAALAVAIGTIPLPAGAQTLRAADFVARGIVPSSIPLPRPPVRVVPRSDPPAPVADARITVTLQGSYGSIFEGQVAVSGPAGAPLAEGDLSREIVVRSSGPVDVVVTATGLVDRPSIAVRGVALPAGGGGMTVPATVETGLIRAAASVGGRTVAGVVWLYRIDEATGAADAEACGSFGANTYGREISAGRYLAVLVSGGLTLSQTVEITAGASRLVRLEG